MKVVCVLQYVSFEYISEYFVIHSSVSDLYIFKWFLSEKDLFKQIEFYLPYITGVLRLLYYYLSAFRLHFPDRFHPIKYKFYNIYKFYSVCSTNNLKFKELKVIDLLTERNPFQSSTL